MGGEIIGRAAGRCRHQHAVADQFLQPRLVVDRDHQLCRLVALAEQGDLVEGDGAVGLAGLVHRHHAQRMDGGEFGRRPAAPAVRPRHSRSSGSPPCRGSCRRWECRSRRSGAASAACGRRRPAPPRSRPGRARHCRGWRSSRGWASRASGESDARKAIETEFHAGFIARFHRVDSRGLPTLKATPWQPLEPKPAPCATSSCARPASSRRPRRPGPMAAPAARR